MSGMCRLCRFTAVSPDSFADLCDTCELEVKRMAFELHVHQQTEAQEAAVAEQDEVTA